MGFGEEKNEENPIDPKEGSKGVEKHHPKGRINRWAQNKMTEMNPSISEITININVLNSQTTVRMDIK